MLETCVFCGLIQEPTVPTVDESEAAIVIVPLNPVTEGHLLVIPRQHAQYIWELDPNHLGYTMEQVATSAYGKDCNIIQSNGEAATQTIKHVHFHIVPRHEGDGLTLPWTGQEEAP